MVVDELVIGSGLAALGAVMGLLSKRDGRRIAVLCGPNTGQFSYYDDRCTVPCSFLGAGGLGSHWHGVIPTGWRHNFSGATDAQFTELFAYFYPQAQAQLRLGSPSLFVPWRAIRPAAILQKLARQNRQQICLLPEPALELYMSEQGVKINTPTGLHQAQRAWVAAGALHTPALLAKTWGLDVQRTTASDHVFCYIGQVKNQAKPCLNYSRDGIFFPATYNKNHSALYTLRPAAFAFSQLDFGIEQRAVFGLPTGSALAKISKRLSPGLLTEAFYNRFGLFGGARVHSVYAQVPVADAYELHPDTPQQPLKARLERIKAATDAVRAEQPYPTLQASRQLDIYLPGIHLHHTLHTQAMHRLGLNTPTSAVQVVDASVLENIGPDHHSFKMMLWAHQRAQSS
jgi:hypothetical protein